jgi:nucleoside-diphosphate-sugar epimerase
MNFLITGGAGSVGRDLTVSLLGKGHRVKVFDRKAPAEGAIRDDRLEWIQGQLEDAGLVREAVRGVDGVIHLAWSFSDDPGELLASDLKGHVVLLDACVNENVSRLFTRAPRSSTESRFRRPSPRSPPVWLKRRENHSMPLPNRPRRSWR